MRRQRTTKAFDKAHLGLGGVLRREAPRGGGGSPVLMLGREPRPMPRSFAPPCEPPARSPQRFQSASSSRRGVEQHLTQSVVSPSRHTPLFNPDSATKHGMRHSQGALQGWSSGKCNEGSCAHGRRR